MSIKYKPELLQMAHTDHVLLAAVHGSDVRWNAFCQQKSIDLKYVDASMLANLLASRQEVERKEHRW